MMAEEKNKRQPALVDGLITGKGSDISSELSPPTVLLTKKGFMPWVYTVWAAAPLTFVALLIYSKTSLPDQWGFHFGTWAEKSFLVSPMIVFSLLNIILSKILYGIPIGNPKRKMVPDIMAYHPRNLRETGRAFLVLLNALLTLTVVYLAQLLIFVELFGIFSK